MTASGPRWWVGHQQGRRPVSRSRQLSGLVLVLLLGGAFLSYRHFTAEDRLRYYAEQWLEGFTGGEAHVDRVEFSPFAGLHLVGVTIATPQRVAFFPPGASLEDRTIFSAGTLLLRLQPFSVVTGDLIVPDIVAVNPRVTLVDRALDGLGNWEVMFAQRKPGRPGKGPMRLPEIRLRNVEVRQYRLNERGRAGGTVQTFYAGANPLPDKPQVYDLRMSKLLPGQDDQTWTGEEGRLRIDLETNAVSGSLPSLSLEELLFVAPPEIHRWLDVLHLSGYVRAKTFRFDPKIGAQASLELRDARLSVPIDATEAQDSSSARYIQFSNVEGRIEFAGNAAEIELRASFRGSSPVGIKGQLAFAADGARGLADLGFDLDLSAERVPLPRCDESTGEPEKRFVRRFNRLAAFVHDFDGKGNVDLAVKLHKQPGPGKGVEFVEGLLSARGTSAAFEEFPYRLHGMSGQVRFNRDGTIDLLGLTGTHGQATATVDGHLGGNTSHDSIDLDIRGRNVPVDADLLVHLPEKDRDLCRNFLQHATVEVDVHMARPAWAWGGQRPAWASRIDVTFIDGAFEYAGFPYRLDRLAGRVRIAEGLMRLDELTGRHDTGTVRASGTVTRTEQEPTRLDIELHATDAPFDEALALALPNEVQKLYRRCAPTGAVNVRGRLHTPTPDGPLEYELNARLDGVGLNLPGIGETSQAGPRLESVAADLQILPDRLAIRSLKGRMADSTILLEGSLALAGNRSAMNVHLASESLQLGEHVRAALPAALQADYDSFAPSGRVRFDLNYEQSADTAAASRPTDDAGTPVGATPTTCPANYTATIQPLDCRLTFEPFPLPLEKVSGRIVLTPGRVNIEGFAARHAEMELRMNAQVELGADVTVVRVPFLQARHVQFTDALRKAVPWRLRRMWADMKPTGSCDFLLNDVVFNRGPGEKRSWQVDGKLAFHGMELAAGPQFAKAEGSLEGRLGFDEQFYMDASLKLERALVDGRLIARASGQLQRPRTSDVLSIRELAGAFYGGGLLGEVEINYAAHPPTYGLNLTARDVSLQEYLDHQRRPGEKAIEAKGRIQGTLALTGQFNHAASRQGSGSVLIQDAQVLKLPMVLAILQIIHFAVDDSNAFHDALFDFMIDGDDVILDRIDLQGKAVSMVGAGRVHITDQAMNLILLVGSPLKLPKLAVLSELVEGVARELMEVHVEGTLDKPVFRAELVRSLRRTLEAMTSVRAERRNHPRR